MKKLFLLFLFVSSLLSAQVVHVQWSMESKKITDCEYDLIFKAKIDKHWHIFSIHQTDPAGPNATAFNFKASSDYEKIGKMTEPKPHKEFDNQFEMDVLSHEGNVSFVQRVKILKSGKITIKGKYEAQQCDSAQCIFPPTEDFKFEIDAAPVCLQTVTTETNTTALATVQIIDTLITANPTLANTKTTAAVDAKVTAVDDTKEPGAGGWFSIFLAGFIGGFAALLTPCVFPMIPMNVSFFTKRSKSKAEGIKNALIYASFIILLYVGLGLGVTMIFGAGALHTLSTNVWFNLSFFVLLLVFAASFLGAFEIVLPSSFVNKMDSKADKGGLIGIFFMAFTLALVSFSCTGPIIGTLLVEAASTGKLGGPFWGMFGFALALSLPFGLFAAFPGWLNSLPSSGGWLNSVKVVLGFLELALALKFASNADLVVQAGYLTREVFISLWIVIFLLQGLYLIGVFKTSHDSDLKHVSVTRLVFAIATFFVVIYLIPGLWGAPLKLFSGILPPLEYSESPHGFGGSNTQHSNSSNTTTFDPDYAAFIETNKNGIVHFKNNYDTALAYAKKVGKPLLVDFTGHACANCRKTEDYVWPDLEITKLLNNEVVLVSLYVDDKRALDPKDYITVEWYGKQREITDIGDKFKYMEEKMYGQSTQPLYVLLNHNEEKIIPVRGYNPSIPEYTTWLREGITKFKMEKK
ncbi:MAG: thioredoxin family protein [Sphingobacteriaceae bacterium]|nr:thioredoxin family protein [Sphingobacteriaceae bacterium]